jgi:hypothetical protein
MVDLYYSDDIRTNRVHADGVEDTAYEKGIWNESTDATVGGKVSNRIL